jgi:PAS domain S-box-containing protein
VPRVRGSCAQAGGDLGQGGDVDGNIAAAVAAGFWGLLDAVPDALIVIAEDGRIQVVNEPTLGLFGYARHELIGQPLEVLLPDRFRAAHAGHRGDYVGDPQRRPMGTGLELFGRRKDGSEFPAEISLAPTRSSAGVFVTAAVRDITARKREEDLSRAREARYHNALDNTLEAVQIVDRDWRYLYVNDAAARLLGRGREEILGATVMEACPGLPATEMFAAMRLCMEERKPGLAEFKVDYAGAPETWLSCSMQPVPEGVFMLSLDITERMRAEEEIRVLNVELDRRVQARTAELEDTTKFLSTIIENIPSMIMVKDARDLTFVLHNQACADLLGVPRGELRGKNAYDYLPKDQAELSMAMDRETLRGRSVVDSSERPVQTKQGPRVLHTKKVPLFGADGEPRFLLTVADDITERKRALEMSLRLAAIVAASDDAIIGKTLDGVVTSWNQGAERVFGYSAQEMIGQRLSRLIPADRGGEEESILARLRRNERLDHFESVRRRKDGREIDVSITVSPIRDATGATIGVAKIARDMTERKRAQEAVARARAAETANRDLESFSHAVAHDLRAPLRSLDGFSQALVEDYSAKLDAEGQKYLAFIRESAQHMAQLIDDLLVLSRVTRRELHCQAVDLSLLARAAIGRLERSQPGRQVDVVIQDGLANEGDSRLLTVALDNLLGNAWKFTGRRPDPRIEFGAIAQDGRPVYFVRDNGAGFDMAFVHKLFGVFQRLHGATEFEGTGVGLATVQRIVQRHGGRVWAEAEIDRGATLYFTLHEEERMT